MSWNNLAEDLDEMFGRMRGCINLASDLTEGHLTLVVNRTGVSSETREEARRRMAQKRKTSPVDRSAEYTRTRKKRLMSRIENWKTAGTMICVGRDLPEADWLNILTHPISAEDIAAREDFVTYLSHKGVTDANIASMLQMQPGDVDAIITKRRGKRSIAKKRR